MKKKLLKQAFLLVVGLLVGTSASWAAAGDKITNLNLIFNGSTSGSLTYVLGTGEVANGNGTGQSWTPGVAVDTENKRLKFANANLTFNLANTGEFQNKDVVTISYDVALGYSTKDANRDFKFYVFNSDGVAIITEIYNPRNSSRHSSSLGFSRDDMYNPGNANTDWANKVHFEIVINYETGKISASSSCATATTTSHEIAAKDLTEDQKKYIGSIKLETGDMNNIDHSNLIANLKVVTTKGDYSTLKTITYAYEDQSGNDITELAISKGATASATAEPGDTYTPTYPVSFTDTEYAYDYAYASGGDAFTVTNDETITLVYTKSAHPTTNVTVQYKYGNDVKKEEVVAENYPVGKSLSYGVHQYLIGDDGVFYQTSQGSNYYYRTTDAAAATITESVTASGINNVVYFTEAEAVSGASSVSQTSRCSMGKLGYTGSATTYKEVTTLAPGKYVIYWRAFNGNSNPKTGNFKVGESGNAMTYSMPGQSTTNTNIEEFTVYASSSLYWASEGSSNLGGTDWFYVVQNADFSAIVNTIADCKEWETSADFATAIDAKYAAGDFISANDVYAYHTQWQVNNGTPSKAILNNEVTSADHWWGTLTEGANYEGAPDTKYLSHANAEYNVNQTVYQLPVGAYHASVWTYSSLGGNSGYRKIYVSRVPDEGEWVDYFHPAATSSGWVKLEGDFTLTEPTNVAFGLYASNVADRTVGFDNWTLTKIANVSKTITSAGWATYCSPYILDFTNDIENLTDAYIVTGGAGGKLVTSSVKGKKVPANTGLLLKGLGACVIPVATTSDEISGNQLTGVTAETQIAAEAGYVLMDGSEGVAFYKNANAFTVGANTAYLPASFDANAARAFFSFGDDATGIRLIENGELKKENSVYDLQGRRIDGSRMNSGIYIHNGRKVVVK